MGLTAKARMGDDLFVYNDGTHAHLPLGDIVCHGPVIAILHDDPDPAKCRYRVWGPGGEESQDVPASACEFTRRPKPPAAPRDAALTGDDLRALLNVALKQDMSVSARAAVAAAVRTLAPHWERFAADGRLTVGTVLDTFADIGRAAALAGTALAAAHAARRKEAARVEG